MAIGQKGSLERMEEHQVGISLGYHSSRMWHKDLGSKVEKYLITCGWWEGAAFHCWSQSRGGFPAGALIHTHTHSREYHDWLFSFLCPSPAACPEEEPRPDQHDQEGKLGMTGPRSWKNTDSDCQSQGRPIKSFIFPSSLALLCLLELRPEPFFLQERGSNSWKGFSIPPTPNPLNLRGHLHRAHLPWSFPHPGSNCSFLGSLF